MTQQHESHHQGALGRCRRELGEADAARRYLAEANRLRLSTYLPATRYNYNRRKEKVLGRGLKLVCVQYPMRGVEALERMLEPAPGVIFVDNERVFQEATRSRGFDRLFADDFAGDFGHLTREGNRLLAENVAAGILREVFGLEPSR